MTTAASALRLVVAELSLPDTTHSTTAAAALGPGFHQHWLQIKSSQLQRYNRPSARSKESSVKQRRRMSSENFCLKWNDHHSVFCHNVESLCQKSFLTDVVLSAGGSLFQAHKLVLSICSTYFQVCWSQDHLIYKNSPLSIRVYSHEGWWVSGGWGMHYKVFWVIFCLF